uniref:LysM peptidoglycan-binding domain-containing protein n=1 Tax=Nosocomiicoccus ampullae TaxID=489910 RepID=UPI0008356A24|nr:LysM peptidoglycan-binding domain-containing protein [Nosocomiicoccus ampullae]
MKKTVFSVATLTALTGTSLTANAEEVIVKEGDTLWGIANEVGTTVEKLKELNNLNSDLIHPEDVLTYEVEAVEEQKGNTYTVKAGDTLWQIALDHGMDLDELFAVNNLSSDLIHPGLVLTVGSQVEAVEEVAQVEEVVETEAVEEVVEPVVEENEVSEVASGVYHIQAGDTLYSISRATGLSVDELKALNGLTSDHIVAGDVLVLEGNPVVTEAVEEVQEVQTEEVVEVEEVAEVENNVQAEAEKAVQEAAAAQAEADRIAAEQRAAAQAEAERVAAEQVAAAQKAEEQRIAAERAEAQRVAKEKAAAEKRAQQEAAKKVQQAQQQQAQQSQAASAPAVNSSNRFANASNNYAWGWCTWHVFEKRAQIGSKIGGTWGNANDWLASASSLGYTINNTPSVGAIAHSYPGTNGAGSYGHVAFVESINGDGSITISEMGWNGTVGVVSYRTIPASQVSTFNYIH